MDAWTPSWFAFGFNMSVYGNMDDVEVMGGRDGGKKVVRRAMSRIGCRTYRDG